MSTELRLKVATVWRGEWSAKVAYNVLDEVSFSAEAEGVKRGNYRSLLAANREPLSNENAWVLVLDLEKTQSATEEAEEMNEAFVEAENKRVEAENKRASAEKGRVEAENKRVTAESGRVEAENKRLSAESARAEAETNRRIAEETRISNEQARESAESGRVEAEADRATAFANAQNEREKAFNAAEVGRNALVAEKVEDITRLQGEVAKKANIDGYYSSMAVGAAESLIGQNITTQQFTFQPSGNTLDVEDGFAVVKSIKGNTVVLNQLVNGNGTLTLTSDRKYYLNIQGVASIITATSGQVLEVNAGDVVIDLTKFFNAGNEPTTIEDFERLYPNLTTEYNTGSLLNLNVDSIKSVGFNQWDEIWEKGGLSQNTGFPSSMTGIKSLNYNKCFGNTEYFVKANIRVDVYWYDYNKQFISLYKNINNSVVTSPNTAFYFKLHIGYNTNIITYNNNVCINLSHSGYRNGEYEPYKESIVNLSITACFPDGMKSVDNIRDEIVWVEEEEKYKAIKRIGVRAYQTGDEEVTELRTDETNTYYILESPEESYIDYELIKYEVWNEGIEEIIADEPTTPIIIEVAYGVNAVDTLNRLPQNYISVESMRGFLAQLGSVMGGNWAMVFDDVNNKWVFSFVANAVVTNEEQI